MSTNYNVQLKDPENPDNFWMPITLKGNIADLTTFDSTHYSTAGLVPASGGESNKFLCADGTWATVTPGTSETWTFILSDGTSVTKNVLIST